MLGHIDMLGMIFGCRRSCFWKFEGLNISIKCFCDDEGWGLVHDDWNFFLKKGKRKEKIELYPWIFYLHTGLMEFVDWGSNRDEVRRNELKRKEKKSSMIHLIKSMK